MAFHCFQHLCNSGSHTRSNIDGAAPNAVERCGSQPGLHNIVNKYEISESLQRALHHNVFICQRLSQIDAHHPLAQVAHVLARPVHVEHAHVYARQLLRKHCQIILGSQLAHAVTRQRRNVFVFGNRRIRHIAVHRHRTCVDKTLYPNRDGILNEVQRRHRVLMQIGHRVVKAHLARRLARQVQHGSTLLRQFRNGSLCCQVALDKLNS